ncbi:hypothetical protein ABIE87_006484 [Bradyrhizobium diazoefficiens]
MDDLVAFTVHLFAALLALAAGYFTSSQGG